MDFAAQAAIDACGQCGQPERAHQLPAGDGDAQGAADVLFALAGGSFAIAAGQPVPCAHYVVSDAALAYERHLSISNGRPGRRQPVRCGRCGNRGHHSGSCRL